MEAVEAYEDGLAAGDETEHHHPPLMSPNNDFAEIEHFLIP